MKLRFVVKQKILTFSDDFIIYDQNKRPAYKVYGQLFTLGNKLTIHSMGNGDEIYIKQKIFKLLPEYHLYRNGVNLAVIRKDFTFFKPKFSIDSPSGYYKVSGDFFNYNFKISKDGRIVTTVGKKFFAMKDTYTVDIVEGEDESLLLAMCIVIDQVFHDNNHNNN